MGKGGAGALGGHSEETHPGCGGRVPGGRGVGLNGSRQGVEGRGQGQAHGCPVCLPPQGHLQESQSAEGTWADVMCVEALGK